MVSGIAYNQVASAVIRSMWWRLQGFSQSDVTGASVGFHVGADAASC